VNGTGPAAGSGEVSWLDDEQRAAWLGVAAIMLRLPGELDSQLLSSARLTFFEYLLLARLAEQPGPRVQMARLAALTNGSLSRLSHVAGRLERRGLLGRERAASSPRYMEAFLTPAGYQLVLQAAPGHVARVRELLIDALSSPELRGLEAAGRQVLASTDPGRPWPS
jgi:DNA-binding MarR family transcriptional regulator